jgi:threonine synthase
MYLECSECGHRFEPERLDGQCTCHNPLLVRYDLERLRGTVHREDLGGRDRGVWRYREWLPVVDPRYEVSLGEGWTPLIRLREPGPKQIWLKDEGRNPTGTFKARGAAVALSRARELGVRRVALTSNGNAAEAWAAYGAVAGIDVTVLVSPHASASTRRGALAHGAHLTTVSGSAADARDRLAALLREDTTLLDVSTFREPNRVEGKKTIGLEIAEQLGWRLPDVVVYPLGGGIGPVAVHKAFEELLEVGWATSERLPRIFGVQAAGCAPIASAWAKGEEQTLPWPNAQTVATGLMVPKPLGDRLVLRILRETGGGAVAVPDEAILRAMRDLARRDGVLASPEGAASLAGLRHLRSAALISDSDEVVLVSTASGMKHPELWADLDLNSVGETNVLQP